MTRAEAYTAGRCGAALSMIRHCLREIDPRAATGSPLFEIARLAGEVAGARRALQTLAEDFDLETVPDDVILEDVITRIGKQLTPKTGGAP